MGDLLGPFPNAIGWAEAEAADRSDPLAHFYQQFVITDPELIYLDGNSLGRLPKETAAHLNHVVTKEWGTDLVSSWGDRWWDLARSTGDMIAEFLGAPQGSVVVADSTSVALFKLAWGALSARPGAVLSDDLNFPTDLYVLEAAGQAAGGCELRIARSADQVQPPIPDLLDSLHAGTTLLSLSHVAFKSGYKYDVDGLSSVVPA